MAYTEECFMHLIELFSIKWLFFKSLLMCQAVWKMYRNADMKKTQFPPSRAHFRSKEMSYQAGTGCMESCPQGQVQKRSKFPGPGQTRGITSEGGRFLCWARVNQSLTHPSTVTVGWWLSNFVPQFCHLGNGNSNPTISTDLNLSQLREIM